MEAEIHLPMKRFSNSKDYRMEGHPVTKNSLQFQYSLDSCLMVTGRVNLCEVSPKVGCVPWGKRPTFEEESWCSQNKW